MKVRLLRSRWKALFCVCFVFLFYARIAVVGSCLRKIYTLGVLLNHFAGAPTAPFFLKHVCPYFASVPNFFPVFPAAFAAPRRRKRNASGGLPQNIQRKKKCKEARFRVLPPSPRPSHTCTHTCLRCTKNLGPFGCFYWPPAVAF